MKVFMCIMNEHKMAALVLLNEASGWIEFGDLEKYCWGSLANGVWLYLTSYMRNVMPKEITLNLLSLV